MLLSTRASFLLAAPLALLLAGCPQTSPPHDGGEAGADATMDGGPADATLDALDGGADADSGPHYIGGDAIPPDASIPDREAGQRAPLSGECDPVDPTRCLLPWPSNVFTVVDANTSTGVRVHVTASDLLGGDDPAALNRADGFSRLSPIVTAFSAALDQGTLHEGTTSSVRLLVAQPGDTLGRAVPLRFNLAVNHNTTPPESLVIAYPEEPLAPGTDYVVVVTDALHAADGTPLPQERAAQVSLDLVPPATYEELALRAYHAPTRALLARAEIDPAHVVRVWDFTTRSRDDATRTLATMRAGELAAIAAGGVTVTIDTATVPTSGPIAAIVEGHMDGLPNYVGADHTITRGADGLPTSAATHSAPFRVMIPAGTGGYRVVMYGHGTGGNIHDDAFDTEIATAGAAKVSLQFTGWTDADVVNTFGTLVKMVTGVDQSTAGLAQSLADGMASERLLAGALGDALSAPTLHGTPNPAAGRRPDLTSPVWAGGSMGGTMGLVYANAEPDITAGVLNVPGTGWTHFVTYSSLYTVVHAVLLGTYRNDVNMQHAVAMSQLAWDDVDGANYADPTTSHTKPFLVQESMGDPVLPNIGNELVAVSLGAVQVGAVLAPVPGVTPATPPVMQTALTQYRVPSTVTGNYDIHGFAARDTPAGVAARVQITGFLPSVWAGAPRIDLPADCVNNTPANSCDFSAAH